MICAGRFKLYHTIARHCCTATTTNAKLIHCKIRPLTHIIAVVILNQDEFVSFCNRKSLLLRHLTTAVKVFL